MADEGWRMAVLDSYHFVLRHPERSEGSQESEMFCSLQRSPKVRKLGSPENVRKLLP